MENLPSELGPILEGSWEALERAVHDRHSPLRRPVLATVDADGGPDARTVVLRGVDRTARRLYINTDRRSGKSRELAKHEGGVFVFFSPEQATQLRVTCEIATHVGDELTRRHWQALPAASRRRYLTAAAPGTPAPAPGAGLPKPTEALDEDAGYRNFAVLIATARRLDWLCYRPQGPVRAAFDWDDDGRCSASWLYP